MIINIIDQQDALKISADQVQRLVKEVIATEGEICDEVSVYFIDTPTICQMHQQFFNDPAPTDCMSFPIDEEREEGHYRLLGDVFICPSTALAYAAAQGGDPYLETTLYLVHALLHLMGYNDIEEEETSLMRRAEERHMQNLHMLNAQLRGCSQIANGQDSSSFSLGEDINA